MISRVVGAFQTPIELFWNCTGFVCRTTAKKRQTRQFWIGSELSTKLRNWNKNYGGTRSLFFWDLTVPFVAVENIRYITKKAYIIFENWFRYIEELVSLLIPKYSQGLL